MADTKEGRLKLTVEFEINETLMEIIKEGMANIPEMIAQQAKKQ